MSFVVAAVFASGYCVRLDPKTVCSSTADCYNTSDCVVDCGGVRVNLLARCVATGGTVDNTATDNLELSANYADNQQCWCAITYPVASKWVFRYVYDAENWNCQTNCARGCRNAFIFNEETDISFRDTIYSNLLD